MLVVDQVGPLDADRLAVRGLLHYTRDPLVYQGPGGRRTALVRDVVQFDALGRVALGRLRVGVDLPIYLLESGAAGVGSAFGDAALDLRAVLADPARAPAGLGLAARLTAPTSGAANALGRRDPELELTVVGERWFGPVSLAVDVGPSLTRRVRLENLTLGSALDARAGAGWELAPGAGLALEATAEAPLTAPLRTAGAVEAEWLASAHTRVAEGFGVRAGVGTGLTSGIGSPELRVILGVSWSPPTPEPPG